MNFIISMSPGNTSHWRVIYKWMNINRDEHEVDLKTSFSFRQFFWQTSGMFFEMQLWVTSTVWVDYFAQMNIGCYGSLSKQTVKSLGQSDTNIHFYTMQRNLSFFFWSTTVYICPVLFHYKKRFFSQYKKSCKIIRDY